jgi:hypothetical protein
VLDEPESPPLSMDTFAALSVETSTPGFTAPSEELWDSGDEGAAGASPPVGTFVSRTSGSGAPPPSPPAALTPGGRLSCVSRSRRGIRGRWLRTETTWLRFLILGVAEGVGHGIAVAVIHRDQGRAIRTFRLLRCDLEPRVLDMNLAVRSRSIDLLVRIGRASRTEAFPTRVFLGWARPPYRSPADTHSAFHHHFRR